jgi:hypothetical protein
MTRSSRLLVVALLSVAAVCGFASSATASSGLAVLALAVIPALFAVPPSGRAVLGMLVLAATVLAVVGLATSTAADFLTWLTAVCLAVAGLLTIWRGRSWTPMGARFEGSDGQPPGGRDDPTVLWKALDRGDDPTG